MTNEEAFKWLHIVRMGYICDPQECGCEKGEAACELFHCEEHHEALVMAVEALEHKDKYKWHRTEASGDKPEGFPFLSIIGDLRNKPRATYSLITIGTKNGHEYMFDWDELKEWGFVVEPFDMPLEKVKVPSAFGRQVVSKLEEHRILAWKEVEEFNE